MINKYRYTVKGIENPLTEIVIKVLNYKYEDNKGNLLLNGSKSKKLTLSDLDDFVNRANSVWETVCDLRKEKNVPVNFEVSSVTQVFSIKYKIPPYVQVGFGRSFYRISIPEEAMNFKFLQESFGEYYRNEDISNVIDDWINGYYTGNLIPKKESGMKTVTQETDSFVISDKEVWSVDSGEKVSDFVETSSSYVTEYKRFDYKSSSLEFFKDCDRTLVCELTKDETGNTNVECVNVCKIETIGMKELIKLERWYREGRSNLPDKVFDNIMAKLGVTEEELQKECKDVPYAQHYNSVGVDSTENVDLHEANYPAESTILSQNKVRDVKELERIVRSWNGKAIVSWKLDGCAVRLYYKGNTFVRAETKGKRRDVTELMGNIKGFPIRIDRGLPIRESWFQEQEWFVTGELIGVNCRRSVPAGYLLRKSADDDDTIETANRLRFVAYDSNIFKFSRKQKLIAPINLYSQMMSMLKYEVGFMTVEMCEFKGGEQISVLAANEEYDLLQPQEFDTDGLVIRVNDIKKYVSMGETSHHPKGSVAFKFEDEWKVVRPTRIYGKTGVYNVVKVIAEFKPVSFGDKVVKSAVWQPKNGTYNWASNEVRINGEKLEKRFDLSKIEVCFRGCVIPQWRPIIKD